MKQYSLEEKLNLIESSASLADVPQDVFPPSHKEDYYFISYSHKDYKRVFKDILLLEEMGVNIWYDSEMHVGENWREIAQMYISKFQCAGIIFYLTENSISSPACNQEVEYALKHNKKYFSINAPLDGCGVQSGYAMLKELQNRGLPCSDALLQNFANAFSDEVLYLSADESIEKKAAAIRSIPREPLFTFAIERDILRGKEKISLSTCRDNSLIGVDLSKTYEAEGATGLLGGIEDCVFANSVGLEKVILPDNPVSLGDFAFNNCVSLTEFDFSKVDAIGKSAFKNCIALQEADLSHVKSIGEYAFEGCTKLTVFKLSGRVEQGAFKDTNVRVLHCDGAVFGKNAFALCEQLEEVHIEGNYTADLADSAFYACKKLKKAGPFVYPLENVLREGERKVQGQVFASCEALEELRFIGGWDISSAFGMCSYCTSLKTLELDILGRMIPDYFAPTCEWLENVITTEPFENIGGEAFKNCIRLKEFDLSKAVTVGDKAFLRTGLTNVDLSNVERIGELAFSENRNLKSVIIGERCKTIAQGAFAYSEQLKLLKVLSETVEVDSRGDTFPLSIKVLFTRSLSVLDAMATGKGFETLNVLYIGENMQFDATRYALSAFSKVDSDEEGFIKYVREGAETFNGAFLFDETSKEFNSADPTQPFYTCDDPSALIGQDVEIKHRRLQAPQFYFIERVHADGKTIREVTVSMHGGKRFTIDGTLIESVKILSPTGYFERFQVQDADALVGKSCCIFSNGESIYATVCRVDIHYAQSNFWNSIGNKHVRAIYYETNGEPCSISGLDIDYITIFNEKFEPVETIKKIEPYKG